MIARLVDWDVLCCADYTLLDIDRDSLAEASQWLSTWATSTGRNVRQLQDALQITGGSPAVDISIRSVCAEFREFLDRGPAGQSVDLLIANAFLDIVDVPATLPPLFRLLVPNGLYWFSTNFDGETIFLPEHPSDAVYAGYPRPNRSLSPDTCHQRRAPPNRSFRIRGSSHPRQPSVGIDAGPSDCPLHADPSERARPCCGGTTR